MKKNQKNEVQRFSARRKVEIVLRVLKGESLDELSRELGVPASRLSRVAG
jgi:transposase-like protein